MATTTVVSAPGKVILHGEHSVVYGKLALAVSINLRTTVTVVTDGDGVADSLQVRFPDLGTSYRLRTSSLSALRRRHDVTAAAETLDANLVSDIRSVAKDEGCKDDQGLVALVYLYLTSVTSSECPAAAVTVTSKIPVGAGLGSSAAFSVSLAGAFRKAFLRAGVANGSCDSCGAKKSNGSASASLGVSRTKNGSVVEGSTNNNVLVDKKAVAGCEASDVTLYAVSDAKRKKVEEKEGNSNGIHHRAAAANGLSNGVHEDDESSSPFGKGDRDEICGRAFLAEKIMHGNPSGIDNTVCTYGGLLSYQHSQGSRPVEAPGNLRILLVDTRVSRNTRVLVDKVRDRLLRMPKVTARVLEAMDVISGQCLDTIDKMRELESSKKKKIRNDADDADDESQEELFEVLGCLIETNQGLLSSLGVSHPSLELVCRSAAARGLRAKLTGAGGGGCAFALVPPTAAAADVAGVKAEVEAAGFGCWEAQIGGAGVAWHAPSPADT